MPGVSASVLVIDDEKEMRNSLSVLLAHAGFSTTVAATVSEGLDLLGQNYYDVVITDFFLPDGTGSDIMKYCREYCPKTRVIVMTGYASLETAVEALRHGAFDYVIKPFDFDLLFHALQRALEHISMMDEIALAKERYRALIEDLHEGYLIVKDGYIQYANTKMADILNCRVDELVQRPVLNFIDYSYQQILKERMETLEVSPGAFFMEEVVLRDCKGNTVPAELRITNTIGEHLDKGVIFICREITERDVLWNRLVRAERLATMGEMMAAVAHELNNKLTPILGYSEILSADLGREQLEKGIEGIRNASLSAQKIVNSLLLFSRREKPAKIRCNVNEIIKNASNMVRTCIGGSRIEIELHLNNSLPEVLADPHQIEQVFTNLLKNSVDALEERGGKITIKTDFDNRNVLIKVTDNGPGIPADILKNIFDPFFSTKQKKNGTGLGLSICHGIMKEHGGDIDVHSCDGETTFTLRLPAMDQVTGGFMPAQESTVLSVKFQKRPKVLVVDDEYEISELLLEVFSEDFHAVTASNGKEALERIKDHDFDVIVSDLKMPELNGMEMYKRLLKEYPEYRNRIVFTTGIVSDLETQEFLQSNNLPYLRKPFKMKELFGAVSRIIEKKDTIS